MRTAIGLALLALLSAGCSDLVAPTLQTQSPADVVLGAGEVVRVDALLRIGFVSVPADTRCPATAECFWAGDGVVAITASVGMGPTYPDTVHTNLDPKAVQFGGYTITLLELRPYPQTPEPPIPADQYAVRLKIERSPGARAPD